MSLVVPWAILVLVFAGNLVLRWPQVYSFVSFGFRDQGSFITLETLAVQKLRLGLDVGYTYGLLPVYLQHVVALLHGHGHIASLGFGVVYLLVMAVFWTLLWWRLGGSRELFVALALLSPYAVIVLPVPAHALLQVSIVFALFWVLVDDLPKALAASIVGWLSVPSLPIVLTGLVCGLIVTGSIERRAKTIADLLRPAALGAGAFLGLGSLLTLLYGWDSFGTTVLPTSGAAMYRAMNYGLFGVGWQFLHPPGARVGYYLGTVVGWWVFGTLLLMGVGMRAATDAYRRRKLTGTAAFVTLCSLLHVAFVVLAFGSGFHVMYYTPVLISGVFAGLSTIRSRSLRVSALTAFVGLGVLGLTTTVRADLNSWKTSARFESTRFLYAPITFQEEWKPILDMAAGRNVLVLSYGNGVSELFPEIHTPRSWFLLPGLLKDIERKRLLEQIRGADVVAEELGETTRLIDEDPEIQDALNEFHSVQSRRWFRVFLR